MKIKDELWAKYPVTDYDTALFLTHWDEPEGSKVLCVGCREESVPNMLSAAGYDVTGVDLREYDPAMPPCNYNHVRGDFCTLPLRESYCNFDVFVSISTIEHFGMDAYGEGHKHAYYDVLGMRRAWELLRIGGHAFVTVPFAGAFKEVWGHWRVYDTLSLQLRLVQDFELTGIFCIVAADCEIGGELRKAGSSLTAEEAYNYGGEPPHLSALIRMTKVPVSRLAPDGR